jgi:hypothetical protein
MKVGGCTLAYLPGPSFLQIELGTGFAKKVDLLGLFLLHSNIQIGDAQIRTASRPKGNTSGASLDCFARSIRRETIQPRRRCASLSAFVPLFLENHPCGTAKQANRPCSTD